MTYLLIGLALFLGLHSLRMFAPAWREARIRQWGVGRWKGVFALLSIAGFVLIVWGFGQARTQPVLLWVPPAGLRHLTALLTLPAFILLTAGDVPRNHFRTWLGHPMLLGVSVWALAHLLASGWLHGAVVFGSFLLWGVIAFGSARRRDRTGGVVPVQGRVAATVACVVIGVALWAGFAFYLHRVLIGVAPFG